MLVDDLHVSGVEFVAVDVDDLGLVVALCRRDEQRGLGHAVAGLDRGLGQSVRTECVVELLHRADGDGLGAVDQSDHVRQVEVLAVLGQTACCGVLVGEVRGCRVCLGAVAGRCEFFDPTSRPADECLRAHDRDVAAAERRKDHREQTHVVEHRQPRDAARVAVDLDAVVDLQAVGRDGLVGDLDACGHAGGAGGVLEVCDGVAVVVLARDRGHPARSDRVGDGVDGDHAGTFLRGDSREEVAHGLGRLGGGEDCRRLAVGEHCGQTVGVAGLVGAEERHGDVARVERGEEADHVLQRLRSKNRDTVTGLGDLLQPGGDRAQPLAELRPGQVLRLPVAFAAVVDEAVRQRVSLIAHVPLDVVDQRRVLVEMQVAALIEELLKFCVQHPLLLWPPRGTPRPCASSARCRGTPRRYHVFRASCPHR